MSLLLVFFYVFNVFFKSNNLGAALRKKMKINVDVCAFFRLYLIPLWWNFDQISQLAVGLLSRDWNWTEPEPNTPNSNLFWGYTNRIERTQRDQLTEVNRTEPELCGKGLIPIITSAGALRTRGWKNSAIFDWNRRLSRKWCGISRRLLWNVNRKLSGSELLGKPMSEVLE